MVFDVLAALAQVLSLFIIMRLVLNMVFPLGPSNRALAVLMNFLVRVTEPILAPIRRLVYRGGPFDFSPMVAIFFLWMISLAFRQVG